MLAWIFRGMIGGALLEFLAPGHDTMIVPKHSLAPQYIPYFLHRPGEVDYLLIAMAIFLVVFVLALGILYLRLHALPDQIAHRSQKIQYQIVCVLGLLAMFTHVNAFWIAGLLLALIDIPDLETPLARIAGALERLAMFERRPLQQVTSRLLRSDEASGVPPGASLSPRPSPISNTAKLNDER